MKKLIKVLVIVLCTIPVPYKVYSQWIMSKDTLAYMWPTFHYFHNSHTPANIDGYTICESFGKAGDVVNSVTTVTPNQALALALRIVGDEERYAVTKNVPYIIPHKFGIVMYLYSHERLRWEFFNFETEHITMRIDFKTMVVF